MSVSNYLGYLTLVDQSPTFDIFSRIITATGLSQNRWESPTHLSLALIRTTYRAWYCSFFEAIRRSAHAPDSLHEARAGLFTVEN